jgi:hypothetical protein
MMSYQNSIGGVGLVASPMNKGTVVLLSFCDCYITLGGTSKVVLEQSKILIDSNYTVLMVCPYRARERDAFDGWWAIYINGVFRSVVSTAELCQWASCAKSSVREIYIHHLRGIENEDTIQFIEALSCDMVFYVHDYNSICIIPTATTATPTSYKPNSEFGYCGVAHPTLHECGSCPAASKAAENYSWYEEFFYRFRDRLTVVAPSQVAADIWRRGFTQLGIEPVVIGHLDETTREQVEVVPRDKLRLAFVGVDTPEKGGEAWRAIASGSAAEKLELYHFGQSEDRLSNVTYVNVDFHDSPTAMTDALMAYNIDAALLWSICPETYSFTYFECLSAGTFILSSIHGGNIAARIIADHTGRVFDDQGQLVSALNGSEELIDEVKRYRASITSRPLYTMSDAFMKLMDSNAVDAAVHSDMRGFQGSIKRRIMYEAKRFKRLHL